jgi:hypothetical protein
MTGVAAFGDDAAEVGVGIMPGMSSGERFWTVVVGTCTVLALAFCGVVGGGGATAGFVTGDGETLDIVSVGVSVVAATRVASGFGTERSAGTLGPVVSDSAAAGDVGIVPERSLGERF